MRCSLSFVLAAFAATVSATVLTNNVPRDLAHERFVRRSPDEKKNVNVKNEVKAKCYVMETSCGTINSFAQTASVQSFQSQTSVTSFQQTGVFPFTGGASFAAVTDWSSITGAFALFANAVATYGSVIIQQQIQIATFMTSFVNLCQTISVFISRIQILGQYGGNSLLMTNYFQFLVTIQGFLGYATRQFGFTIFVQTAGASWGQFTSYMMLLFQYGQNWGFFRDPRFCIGQGFNMVLWANSWGFTSLTQIVSINQFQTDFVNVGTFGGSAGFQLAGFSAMSQTNFQQTITQTSQTSSSGFISGGGGGRFIPGGNCYPNCDQPPRCYPNCGGGGGTTIDDGGLDPNGRTLPNVGGGGTTIDDGGLDSNGRTLPNVLNGLDPIDETTRHALGGVGKTLGQGGLLKSVTGALRA